MSPKALKLLALVLLPVLCAGFALADNAIDAYRAQGIRTADVLTGTVLTAKVLPGADKQVVALTTYMTGKRERSDAVNVRLDVFARVGDELTSIYHRDFGDENGGNVASGDLQLVDLDMDGINEIIASFDSFADPLIEQRLATVILHDQLAFRTGWFGLLEYDATRAARNVPLERRDRYRRQIDFGNTMRTRGITLFMNKQMIAVAGERLPQPKVIQETFPLRPRKELQ